MATYKVILDDKEILEFNFLSEATGHCKENNQYKKYIVICPELQYTLLGTRISPTQIDWVNSDMFEI